MKKLFLLLLFVVLSNASHAQQRAESVVFNDGTDKKFIAHEPLPLPGMDRNRKNARRDDRTTTAGNGRWYNYADYLSTILTLSFSGVYLWNDTTSVDAYSAPGGGTEFLFNTITSAGMVCDPFIYGWNDPVVFPGMMQLTTADAYTIDSVFISGIYYRNNAKTTPVDTLTVAVIYGDGTTPTDLHAIARDTIGNPWIYTEYGVDTLYYQRMPYDSINNRADTFAGGVTPVVNQLYLKSSDTSANYQAIIPVSINVPAGGNMPAVSVTFKSGDASFVFGDTVFESAGSYNFGMFRPLIAYQGTTTAAMFPTNSKADQNQGEFRYSGYTEPHHLYTPQWFWTSSGGGAATLQYPYFAFHITCPTCIILDAEHVAKKAATVNVFPNPANSELTVNYDLAASANVSVSLTNIMGQTVAIENTGNTTNGKAIFNTSALPEGVYIYTVIANGERTIGRIVVAH